MYCQSMLGIIVSLIDHFGLQILLKDAINHVYLLEELGKWPDSEERGKKV